MERPYKLNHCFPMLFVPDVTEAQKYYRDKLGFDVVEAWTYGEPPIYGGVMLDGTIFHFAEGESEPKGVHILVYVKGIAAYYEEIQRTKVDIESELESHDYGETQFSIKDLNGYTICFTETTSS